MPAIPRYRRRTPAANSSRNIVPARITVVPRSGCSITSPQTRSDTGSSGSTRCPRSSSVPHRRARIDAANTTTASFAISEGWTVTGPSSNHRDEPYAETPMAGCSTRINIATVTSRIGTASRRQASIRMRDVTTSASTPTRA